MALGHKLIENQEWVQITRLVKEALTLVAVREKQTESSGIGYSK
jgi:hypothetical protein